MLVPLLLVAGVSLGDTLHVYSGREHRISVPLPRINATVDLDAG